MKIVTALTMLAVGAILAFVGAVQLRRFGAGIYVADLVGVASVRSLIGGHEPDPSWLGIGLATFTAPTVCATCVWYSKAAGRM